MAEEKLQESIVWKKLDAGEYESEDKRWYIFRTWDRIHGKHWSLQDNNEPDWYKCHTACESLTEAKRIARYRREQQI